MIIKETANSNLEEYFSIIDGRKDKEIVNALMECAVNLDCINDYHHVEDYGTPCKTLKQKADEMGKGFFYPEKESEYEYAESLNVDLDKEYRDEYFNKHKSKVESQQLKKKKRPYNINEEPVIYNKHRKH